MMKQAMFEQIVGHHSTVAQLTHSVQQQSLPRAILIGGPIATGKCTMALELARLLNCNADRAPDCACAGCQAMSSLAHPGVALLGTHYLAAELGRVFEAARAQPMEPATARLVLFSLRKALKRVDPTFVSLPNAARQRKLTAGVERIEEQIAGVEALLSSFTEQRQKELLELYEGITGVLEELLPLFPKQIPIDTVRAVREWLYQPVTASLRIARKIVIIEQSEQLSIPSANALLKAVEETPDHAVIIFLATDPGRLLPTLRSRVRQFLLHRRPISEQHEVIRRVFHYAALEESLSLPIFLQGASPLYHNIHGVAQQLVEAIEQHHTTLYQLINRIDALIGDKRFGQEEAILLVAAIKAQIMERWRTHNRQQSYTQFADHAFAVLQRFQRNVEILHFNVKELVLPMLLELKKSYATIH